MLIPNQFRRKHFHRRLLAWYKREKRSLPWRKTKDPYKIWVSEIMLQQTQVATVIPYYQQWIKSFPDLESLANAPLSKALKHWEGLGYYKRVRMLHTAAKQVMSSLGGQLPNKAILLEKIPGIGRYTAGAIASIAFEEKAPVLDGNVIRILTRIFAVRDPLDKPKTIQKLWIIAAAILPEHSIGNFNQALMELGATVCYPQNPECSSCPVRRLCKAYALGKQTSLPSRNRKKKYKKLKMYAVILRSKDQKVLLRKQPEGHWWQGFWTFPFWNTQKELLGFVEAKAAKPSSTIRHSITRYHIELRVFSFLGDTAKSQAGFSLKWVKIKDLDKVALPAPHRKISALL